MFSFLGVMPRWAWVAIGVGLLVLFFFFALDRYGDARYDAGKAKADAEWKEASDRLIQKAANSGAEASEEAAARAADYAAKVEDEQKRIEHAKQEGSSPFDVLFGS